MFPAAPSPTRRGNMFRVSSGAVAENYMGMSVGENTGGAMAEMNVVPLIDILLVLLIIFMVITPLTPRGFEAMIPQPNPNLVAAPSPAVIVVQVLGDSRTDTATLR